LGDGGKGGYFENIYGRCYLASTVTINSTFRQPHSIHFPPGSPHPAHIASSQSSCTFALITYHSLDLSLQT